jgi:phenylacetate-CoA ligase
MLLVRGANVYPSAIENVLRQIDGVGREYRIIVERPKALDELRLEIEYDTSLSSGSGLEEARRALDSEVRSKLRQALGIRCDVVIVDPGTHEPMLFKARRVVDKRPVLQ